MVTSRHAGVNRLAASRVKRLQPYFEQGAEFHGYLSPGLVLGIIMVDLAKELLGPRHSIDAVVETKACLPDAIQLMTPCSYGNGWMRVKDWGKLALTLYDKHELDGIRVFVNLEEIKKYPSIERWLMRMSDIDEKEVAREVMTAERDILSWQRVKVTPYEKIKKAPLVTCSSCGEMHPATNGDLCIRCRGKENYYEVSDDAMKIEV